MNVSFNRKKNIPLEVRLNDLESWGDGDKLVRYLKRSCSARIDDYAEGPDARRWFIKVGECRLLVDQNDLGDLVLSASDQEAENVLQNLAERLQEISLAEFSNRTRTLREQILRMFFPPN